MRLADLETVLSWAADEGWNPGLADAPAFLAADPAGFFLAEIDGTPAAAISVVNHDADHAFLGLYLCRPAHRGKGIGYALWKEALRHAGTRAVTLDGVPAQQENYRRSGFAPVGKTVRYAGQAPEADALMQARALSPLIEADAKAVGHRRDRFASAWFESGADRRTLAHNASFATYRRCPNGVKIGPFLAETEAEARCLLGARPFGQTDGPIFIDVPETCAALTALVRELGFEPTFETARMTKGQPPNGAPPPFYAVATLELG